MKKIEDYKDKEVVIHCSSKEEWDKIDNLFGKKGLTRNYGDVSDPDNMFVDCIHINGMGTASKEYYEEKTYTIYPASDFLEKEFEIGKWYKCNYNGSYYTKIKKKIPRKNYNEIHGNVIYMNTFREDDYLANTLIEQNLFLLEDLSEIQQFLPENHEDKFKISIKETFKKGDIVVAKPNNGLKDSSGSSLIYHHFTTEYQYEIKNTKEDLIQFVGDKTIWFHAKDFQLFSEKKSIYKIGDWIIAENAEQPKAFQISEITDEYYKCHDNDPDVLGFSIKNSKKLGLRKALPHEIPHQYPLTPKECFKPNIYDFGDIFITPITKKTKKLQTITIESSINLNLNLTQIKSKQIKTVKI